MDDFNVLSSDLSRRDVQIAMLEMEIQLEKEKHNRDARVTAEPLLSLMPEVFTLQQFKEERIRQGLSGEVKMLLARYCRKGKLERMEKGIYRIINSR